MQGFAGWDFSEEQTFGAHNPPWEGHCMVVEILRSNGTCWPAQKHTAVNTSRQSWEPVQELAAYFSKLSFIFQRR